MQFGATVFHGLSGVSVEAINNALFWKDYDVSTQLPKTQFFKPPG